MLVTSPNDVVHTLIHLKIRIRLPIKIMVIEILKKLVYTEKPVISYNLQLIGPLIPVTTS